MFPFILSWMIFISFLLSEIIEINNCFINLIEAKVMLWNIVNNWDVCELFAVNNNNPWWLIFELV